jgi:hypothetical protein
VTGKAFDVQVTYYPEVIDEIAMGDSTRALLQDKVNDAAADLRSEAPVRTGAGRASITATTERDGTDWVGKAGWDDEHYYMGILNSRDHWAEPTVQRVRYV